jgi:D-serine deaminase-like pyridoxal phosphate-dependent protein
MTKSKSLSTDWFVIKNADEIASPALLVYPERIEENIKRMIAIAGNAGRLWPHVKTHKMSEVVKLQMKHGIGKFKCATVSEAEMVANCGASEIILAIQPAGPNIERYFQLRKKFPAARISCISDSEDIIRLLSDRAVRLNMVAHVWLDMNVGMNRTGIVPGPDALKLFRLLSELPGLNCAGLHVYDGHIHDADYTVRENRCNEAFAGIDKFIAELEKEGLKPDRIVAGGTPSFPVHALRQNVDCSPGTLLLWDFKSSDTFRDMKFLQAAILLTRVISKPAHDTICIDLGHKAVASEMPHPRIKIPGIGNFTVTNHSEEHMVIRTEEAAGLKTGDHLYCIPYHICPTVDRHDFVTVVKDNLAIGQWKVEARKRKITI